MTAERHSLYLLPASSHLAAEDELPSSFPLQVHIRSVARDMPRQDPSKLHIVSWKITAHSIQSIGQGKYSLATRSSNKARREGSSDSDQEEQTPRSSPVRDGDQRPLGSWGPSSDAGSEDGFYSPALSSSADSTASDPLTNWTVTPSQPEMESIITAQTFPNSARKPSASRTLSSPKLYDPFEIHSENSTLVPLADFGHYIDVTLKNLGVFRRARRDFQAYWMPRFKTTPYIAVRFVQRCEYENEMPIYVTSDWPVSIHRVLAIFRRVRIDEVPYWHAPTKKQLTANALSSASEEGNNVKHQDHDWRRVAALPDWTHDPGLTLVEVGGMDVGSRSVYFN